MKILSLFFTKGISLKVWIDTGLFDREKLIYEKHLINKIFDRIYWITYGSEDKEIAQNLKNENRLHEDIMILAMPKIFNIPKVGNWLYSFFLPFYYIHELKKSDIYKTNQIDGSWSAVISKYMYKKKLFIRTGYTLTQFMKKNNTSNIKQLIFRNLERFAFNHSDISSVSSNHDKTYIFNSYGINNIKIIPNFIDVNKFNNSNKKRFDDRILFVGRLNEQKNLFNLFEAISNTKFKLDVYGEGELRIKLSEFAVDNNIKVEFKGKIQNCELPFVYNSYKYFILPSFYEGMPKTLLEAMACGCICLATDVSGNNELVEDMNTGILIKTTDSKEILNNLKNIKNNKNDEIIISKNSVSFIEKNYSLNKVFLIEKKIYEDLLNE